MHCSIQMSSLKTCFLRKEVNCTEPYPLSKGSLLESTNTLASCFLCRDTCVKLADNNSGVKWLSSKMGSAKMDRYPSEKLVRKIVAIWYVGVKFFLFHLKSMNPIYNLHFKLFLYSHPFTRKMHTKLKIPNEFCLF
jgi:hypothetical protein